MVNASGNNGFRDFLREVSAEETLGVIPINKYPWIIPTVIGRLSEEIGIRKYLVLTSIHTGMAVEEGLSHLKNMEISVYIDTRVGLRHTLTDNVFDTSSILIRLFKEFNALEKPARIIIDLTGTDGATAAAITYSAEKSLDDRAVYTVVDSIPLYGIPAYPGSPRWLHRVYVFGDPGIEGGHIALVDDYPRNVEWRGTRGVYIALSKAFNTVTKCGCLESLSEDRRKILDEGEKLVAWAGELGAINERKRLFTIDELKGPDEMTAKQLYTAWKNVSEILVRSFQDRQALDRMIMQIQRYVGAADLIAREIVSQSKDIQSMIGEKLHRILLRLAGDKGWAAVVPDTNLFYQGFHMALLKASIRAGAPWSPIRGLSIYIPRCAEAEINGKVAETNPDSGLQYKISYSLALMANRALLETKYYYDAESLSATAQPCEAAIAVEAPNLREGRILLLTADHKAFNAWQTLNVCRGKVSCIYIAHSDQPIGTNSLYGKFYASISASLLAYTASLFTPVVIEGSRGRLRLVVRSLRGSTAPVISVYKIYDEERVKEA